MYLSSFTLPVREEDWLIQRKMIENGGKRFGYVDNVIPADCFQPKNWRPSFLIGLQFFMGEMDRVRVHC